MFLTNFKSPYVDDIAELPPEFRSAGLTAQMEIHCGKVFGPFSGIISERNDPPKSPFALVCQVRNMVKLARLRDLNLMLDCVNFSEFHAELQLKGFMLLGNS